MFLWHAQITLISASALCERTLNDLDVIELIWCDLISFTSVCVCSAVMVTDLGLQPKGHGLNPGVGSIHEPEIYRDPVSIVLLSGALNPELPRLCRDAAG